MSILIKGKNWIWIGLKIGFLLLWIGTVVSIIGLYLSSNEINSVLELFTYFLIVNLIVSIYASLPLIIISLAFGYAIKYNGKKIFDKTNTIANSTSQVSPLLMSDL